MNNLVFRLRNISCVHDMPMLAILMLCVFPMDCKSSAKDACRQRVYVVASLAQRMSQLPYTINIL